MKGGGGDQILYTVIEPIARYKLKRGDTTWISRSWVNFSMNFADILPSCMHLCAAARLGKEDERLRLEKVQKWRDGGVVGPGINYWENPESLEGPNFCSQMRLIMLHFVIRLFLKPSFLWKVSAATQFAVFVENNSRIKHVFWTQPQNFF